MDEEVGEHGQLLLIEDDPTLVMLLSQLLAEEGYALDVARDGQRGLHLALTRSYDVVILDRGLPVLDGIDLLTRLRSTGFTTPVLILSALSNPADRVRGLDAGAEDYLSKPFNVDELLARLRALRRRHLDTARALPIGKASLNIETRQVVTDAERESIRLSERECDLLAVLARRPTRVFTRRDLLDLAFPEAESEAVVDTYIHYLRKKLGRAVITTVHGRGYQLGSA
ncbi:MAG TPA: response regulator transcription factor [Pseudonocardiaceae bacterium]|jgi:two-component system response regulator QseB|nr:response regulator transcription factor [Pseudonocardiaceae bacterium]